MLQNTDTCIYEMTFVNQSKLNQSKESFLENNEVIVTKEAGSNPIKPEGLYDTVDHEHVSTVIIISQ